MHGFRTHHAALSVYYMLADSCSLCVVAEAAAEASARRAAAVALGAPWLRSAGRVRPLLKHMEHAGAAPVATGCRTGSACAACPCTSGRRQPAWNPGAHPFQLTAPSPYQSPRDHWSLQSLAPRFFTVAERDRSGDCLVGAAPGEVCTMCKLAYQTIHAAFACQRAPATGDVLAAMG